MHPLGHGRPLFESQPVHRDVGRPQADGAVQRVLPIPKALVREAVYQIDARVLEPGGDRRPERLGCLSRIVSAAQQAEKPVVETLHADAQPVESRLQERLQAAGRHVAWVRLQSNLG